MDNHPAEDSLLGWHSFLVVCNALDDGKCQHVVDKVLAVRRDPKILPCRGTYEAEQPVTGGPIYGRRKW